MFLFVLSYVSVYLALIEKYKASFFSMLPAFLLYFLVAALQYNVGTDYFSYIDIFNNERADFYYINKGEILFAYLNKVLRWFDASEQSIFIAISFIQSLLVFLYFKMIKKRSINLWIFFVVFFCATNIYNNQLNGLRQYVVISALPLLTIYVYEKRFLSFFVGLILASLFHATAWFLMMFLLLYYLYNNFRLNLFLIFFLSAIGYLFVGNIVSEIISFFLPGYSHYLDGDYAKERSMVDFITKLYYLPLILYFYYVYEYKNLKEKTYFDFMVYCFSLTYWFFLLALYMGLATRFYYYVVFFIAFPIYYLLSDSYRKNKVLSFVAIGLYVISPYVAKVTFLAKAEFLYKSILWN